MVEYAQLMSPSGTAGRRRWLVAVLALFATLALSAGAFVWRRARQSAESSCLASVHRSLSDQRAFAAVPAAAEWRDWTESQAVSTLAHARPGDCSGDWWKRDVGIRTRRTADGRIDSWLWRTSDPKVSSGPTVSSVTRPDDHVSR
jgi:hypothetical protein